LRAYIRFREGTKLFFDLNTSCQVRQSVCS
jgi:hypothetical protein